MSSIIIGVVTGVLSAALLFIINIVWTSRLKPFLEETRYQGVVVNGAWVGETKTEELEHESRLHLEQSAHKLTGSFFVSYVDLKTKENSYNIDFLITGYMWEGYVTLNFLPKNKTVTSYATSLLKISDGGTSLRGEFTYRNIYTDKIETIPIELAREKLD